MKRLGRTLQIVGLTALPLAMILEITEGLDRSFGLSEMLIMLVFGVCAFVVGRFVEGYARPS